LFFLQDDLKKFVSELSSPPQLVEVPEEGKAKSKERREVGEGDDTVVVEDTSEEDDDEETLQDRFQLQLRFSRPGLPHIPLVQDQPASLEASLLALPRRPCNAARKRVAKKLKVTETTSANAAATEGVAAAEAQEETPAEAGLVDIASILGAPTVTVVRSSL
jgi:hypothetical protein